MFFIYEIVKYDEKPYFPHSVEILWKDDCVDYLWKICTPAVEFPTKIYIYELSPSDADYKVELIQEEIKIEDFLSDIYLSLEEMFAQFGFVGYKKNWGVGNFPIYEYITLKANKEKMKLQKADYSTEEDSWKQKIIIEDELRVICRAC